MRGRGRMNDASRARSVQRRIKEGKDPSSLVGEVAQIRDPYHRALGYIHLVISPKAKEDDTDDWLDKIFSNASSVKQEWRRGELLVTILKKLKNTEQGIREKAEDLSLKLVENTRPGSGLSQAIRGISPYIEKKGWPRLLDASSRNRGFEKGDTKAVIRSVIQSQDSRLGYEVLLKRIKAINEPEIRAQLLWYLHLQARKNRKIDAREQALEETIVTLGKMEGEKALKTFSYLCRNCVDPQDLIRLEKVLDIFPDTYLRIKALGNLATAADRTGNIDKAEGFLELASIEVASLQKDAEKASALMIIASAIARLGKEEEAKDLFNEALEYADKEMNLKDKIETQMAKHGLKEQEDSGGPSIPERKSRRHILALYDTYEGGLKPVHSRAVARAAPLCAAFGLDLALMGFPSNDLERIVELSEKETNIGRGGAYIRELHRSDRIMLVDCSGKNPPSDWSDLGLPVATSSRPDKLKSVKLGKAMEISRSGHPEKRICLIMGLGRKGLPDSLLRSVPHHLEITGVNIPLETATAMGILAYMIHAEDNG